MVEGQTHQSAIAAINAAIDYEQSNHNKVGDSVAILIGFNYCIYESKH